MEQRAGRGGAAPLSTIQKRQWDETDKPYMGVGKRCLESGGGVRIPLPPNLKFRKLLKSADSSGTCIHPALRQGTNGLQLKIQVAYGKSPTPNLCTNQLVWFISTIFYTCIHSFVRTIKRYKDDILHYLHQIYKYNDDDKNFSSVKI